MAPTKDITASSEAQTETSLPQAKVANVNSKVTNKSYTLSQPSQMVRDVGAALKAANDKVNAFRK